MDAAEGVWQVIDPASEEAAEARAMVGRQAMLHGLQARLQLSLTVTLTPVSYTHLTLPTICSV